MTGSHGKGMSAQAERAGQPAIKSRRFLMSSALEASSPHRALNKPIALTEKGSIDGISVMCLVT